MFRSQNIPAGGPPESGEGRRARTRATRLTDDGYDLCRTPVDYSIFSDLRNTVFVANTAGARCLLDIPVVRDAAIALKHFLKAEGILPEGSIAIQAISFDKTARRNWTVTWHQDVMFPFARPVTHPGFDLPCVKGGVDYARPPAHVLNDLLAVRLHLDECDTANGPLRVSPGSHRCGILRSNEIPDRVAQHEEIECPADEGVALLMKPLLLHASSPASVPRRRRVLHLVYYTGAPIPEEWHRSV